MKKLRLFAVIIAIFMAITVFGCGKPGEIEEQFDDNDELYTIKYFIMNLGSTNGTMPDLKMVEDEVNKITLAEINAKVELTTYHLSEYSTRVSGAILAGADWDLCFTSPAINSYFTNVQKENFFPLDYILPKYAPVTFSQVAETEAKREAIWNQTKVNGKIYGTINMQIQPRTMGMDVNNVDMFEEWIAQYSANNFTPKKTFATFYEMCVDENGNDDMNVANTHINEYLKYCKSQGSASWGGLMTGIDLPTYIQNGLGFDDLGTTVQAPGVVRVSDSKEGGITVINQFETDEFNQLITWLKTWKTEGVFEQGTANAAGISADMQPNSTWKPGFETITAGKRKDILRMGKSNMFTSFIIGTMNAINRYSKNPARTMKFIELLSTNQELHNLLQFGVEGTHFEFDESRGGKPFIIQTEKGWDNLNFGWGLGNEFQSYLTPTQPAQLWDDVKEINRNAEFSGVIGFNFDSTPVSAKVAACTALFDEYLKDIMQGKIAVNQIDARIAEYKIKLVAAGANDIIAEKQKQLNAWLAA